MKALKIMVPAPITSVTNVSNGPAGNVNALLTPDPKEAAILYANAGAATIDFDLGAPRILDTFFFGFNTVGPEAYVQSIVVGNNAAAGNGTNVYSGFSGDNSFSVTPTPLNPRLRHGVVQLAAPVVGRYVRLQLGPAFNVASYLGVFACGASFTARFGTEYGAGRPLTDTSNIERLFGGGFGIDLGTVASGYSWTFGDLSNSEREALFRMIARTGTGRSILVIEDPDFVYTPFVNLANTSITGGGKVVTKTSGGNTAYDGAAISGLVEGTAALSVTVTALGTAGALGFAPAPAALSDCSGLTYGAWMAYGGLYRTVAGVNTQVATYGAGDRIAVVYDEAVGRYSILQNGAIVDAYQAVTGRVQGGYLNFYSQNDRFSDVNLSGLHYDERVHWGLFSKLDTFERLDPLNTKWSLQIGDWA